MAEATQTVNWSTVEGIIYRAESSGGVVGATIVAPTEDTFEYNGARRFRAASIMKIPLMIEIFRQIERGERSLDDRYTLKEAEKAPGSGVMLHLHDGMVFTLHDLLYLMISISDNTATNLLIDMAGMQQVNRTMRELGMVNSTLGRKMLGRPVEDEQQENWATPDDYVTAVQAILDGQAASEESCQQMIALLELQQNRRRIARHLPEEKSIRWGTKTGSIRGVTNDVGFISTPQETLVLAIFCENFPDQHAAEAVIGAVSRAAMAATGIVKPLYTS
ncbi:MAG TPA: serine hydrolase [Thermomicrobiaceae bacterium]|nr:serine hydrolase [Thermomicrobiaceae bacterium]